MSIGAVDGSENQLFTYTVVVLVVSGGASASVDLCVVDGVKRADGASSLELELSSSARQHANSTTVLGKSSQADTLTV